MDWSKLSFNYEKTNTILVCHYKDGEWGEIISTSDDNLTMASLAGCLHYGLQCFEGLKAFNCADGKIRIFRPDENAERLIRSAQYLGIPYPEKRLFTTMVCRAVEENKDFIPPHDVKGSLYIRPLLIGAGPQIGLYPSAEATFVVIVNPVGFYKGSELQPSNTIITREYDRSAANGSGSYKVGGNYAAAMYAGVEAKKRGFADVLYLDAKEYKYIEEFSSSNFFGIKDNTYITPMSNSILPSITNKSLQVLAHDFDMVVETRRVPVEEVASFDEVGECGTAVVITPVNSIDNRETFDSPADMLFENKYKDEDGNPICGPISRRLYMELTNIQKGIIEDRHNWTLVIE